MDVSLFVVLDELLVEYPQMQKLVAERLFLKLKASDSIMKVDRRSEIFAAYKEDSEVTRSTDVQLDKIF